jgi:uncharacterized protein YjiS (DUF1127 family)
MDLLHRLRSGVATKLRELDTIHLLNRLNDRSLADLGLTRDEIRPVAKLAAWLDSSEVALTDIVARVRQDRAVGSKGSNGLVAALGRAADRMATSEVAEYQPSLLDQRMAAAHRARDAAVANLLSKAGSSIAAVFRSLAHPVMERAAASELYQRWELARIRRQEFSRLRTQLDSYSDRELMADLRLTRSEIEDVAAEGAQQLVDSVARSRRSYWQGSDSAARRTA